MSITAIEPQVKPVSKHAQWLPLLQTLLTNPECTQAELIQDATQMQAAQHGIKQCLVQHFMQDKGLRELLGEVLWQHGHLRAQLLTTTKSHKSHKYAEELNCDIMLASLTQYRALKLCRGRQANILRLSVNVDDAIMQAQLLAYLNKYTHFKEYAWIMQTLQYALKTQLMSALTTDMLAKVRALAEQEAINLIVHRVQRAASVPPNDAAVIMALDAHLRTGIYMAIIDAKGQLLDTEVIIPGAPLHDWYSALASLAKLIVRYKVCVLAIGEHGVQTNLAKRLVRELCTMYPDLKVQLSTLDTCGVLPATETDIFAHVTSIARQLKNPLTELMQRRDVGVGCMDFNITVAKLNTAIQAVFTNMCKPNKNKVSSQQIKGKNISKAPLNTTMADALSKLLR